jgi:hypothetical protein
MTIKIQGGLSCQHHNIVQVSNNLKTLSPLNVNAQTVEKKRKYFLTNLISHINAVGAARRLTLTSVPWMLEFRKLAGGKK